VQLPYETEEIIQDVSRLEDLLQETALFLWKDWPRDMQAVGHDGSGNFALNGICPHCKRPSVFLRVQATTAGSAGNNPQGYPLIKWIAALQCQGCKGYILCIAKAQQGTASYEYITHYPLGAPDDSVATEIPVHIQPDFKEALRCRFVDAYNATAEMCRRALEASCIDLGASPKDVLEDMIDELSDKRIITPFLQKVAHKIRLGGNRGAHPSPQELQQQTQTQVPSPTQAEVLGIPQPAEAKPITMIGKDHADAIIKFTREFFHHVYVVPKELDKYDFSKPKAAKS
jgi:hypothetical protein